VLDIAALWRTLRGTLAHWRYAMRFFWLLALAFSGCVFAAQPSTFVLCSGATATGVKAGVTLAPGAKTFQGSMTVSSGSGTATVTGATTGMAVIATPVTYPGDGAIWKAYVSSADTVTVKVCGLTIVTPTASAYNVRVFR
jgi:hypothetical protein